jgi:hypothetical protein
VLAIVEDALDETNETVIVTLSSPSNATLGANTAHTHTIIDDDGAPTVAFNATSSSATEAAGNQNLVVDLSAASGQAVTVSYTVTGTATSGTDYTLANGTTTIAAGTTSTTVVLAIVEDALDETNETVIVTLSSPSNATLGANTAHTHTINDDDEVFAIGNTGPAGGIVFYITDGGLHGLEAAAADQESTQWGCYGTTISGANGTVVGTGEQNTADIIADCNETTAASVTSDYVPGWYLPSKDELNLLYSQKDVVGGFASNYYWSSSQDNSYFAWYQYFGNGNQFGYNKYRTARVRAVRAF